MISRFVSIFLLISFTSQAFHWEDLVPYDVVQKPEYFTMKDGTKIWACVTYPVSRKKSEKFPAILIMDPYAGECTLARYDEGFLAGNGYIIVMAHVRGTGKSKGMLFDREYSEQELQDGYEIISQLSKRKECTGKVGMTGGSWSGFNSIQVASMKPPALKAIVAYVATENLYHEDVRYADGIMRFDDYDMLADLNFATTTDSTTELNAEYFKNRFDRTPLSLVYLKQQRDGKFWRPEIRWDKNPDTLKIPALLVGGWYDGYRTSVLRGIKNLKSPVKAIVGPWDHSTEFPNPKAEHRVTALRWWDYWLKGKANGILQEPVLTAYIRRPYFPSVEQDTIPGFWMNVGEWPPKGSADSTLYFRQNGTLNATSGPSETVSLRYVPTVGTAAGIWWGEVTADQRSAEVNSLVYQSEIITHETAILGQPLATLTVTTSAAKTNWVVRLSDVAPDGTVTLITGGAVNGNHITADQPADLIPGKSYTIKVPLHFTSWVFERGHRIRISVANGLWPMFWPTPTAMITTLTLGGVTPSNIKLPVITIPTLAEQEKAANHIGSVNVKSTKRKTPLNSGTNTSNAMKVITDQKSGKVTASYEINFDGPGTDDTDSIQVQYEANEFRPEEAAVLATEKIIRQHRGDQVVWTGETNIRSDATWFYYRHTRRMYVNGGLVRKKEWVEKVRREFQ